MRSEPGPSARPIILHPYGCSASAQSRHPMSSAAVPCVRCGAHRVTRRQGPGRTCAYRVFPALPIPDNVEIPTCGRCSAQYSDEQTAATLEPVLAAEYRTALQRRAKQAIADLSPHISQSATERLIDISQGYLSRLYGGHGTPSPQLVALLALLAHDPTLLDWVTIYWAEPISVNVRKERNTEPP